MLTEMTAVCRVTNGVIFDDDSFAAVIPWYTHNPIGSSSKDTPPYSVLVLFTNCHRALVSVPCP
jgi:hypothetical protein